MTMLGTQQGHRPPGVIGRTADEPVPDRLASTREPTCSPKVVFIVPNDTRLRQLGSDGSQIDTSAVMTCLSLRK
jgi:hypothetical protein